MNKDCEALIELYGALQQATPQKEDVAKEKFDKALRDFAANNGISIKNFSEEQRLRAFVVKKWNGLLAQEAKRRGQSKGTSI